MLLYVSGYERSQYEKHFDDMFRHRKKIFHDEKQWNVSITDEHYEIDEYDRDDTCYLMSIDDHGNLVGSVRLISTIMPHMLSGTFKSMFPDLQFKAPTIWEATRFAVVGDRSLQPSGVSRAACEIMLGVVTFGLDNGMRHIMGVYDASVLRLYRRCGFAGYRELGRYRTTEHGTVYAGICEITAELARSVRLATGLDETHAKLSMARAA